MDFLDWDSYFVFNPKIQDRKFMLKFMMVLCRFWIWKRVARVRLLRRFNVGPDSAVLLLSFLLKIRSVRILDKIVCLGTLLWLFSPTWDAVKLTLQVSFICPFVVIDPTHLGATIVVAQPYAQPSSTYPRRRKPAFLPIIIKPVCVCVCA